MHLARDTYHSTGMLDLGPSPEHTSNNREHAGGADSVSEHNEDRAAHDKLPQGNIVGEWNEQEAAITHIVRLLRSFDRRNTRLRENERAGNIPPARGKD